MSPASIHGACCIRSRLKVVHLPRPGRQTPMSDCSVTLTVPNTLQRRSKLTHNCRCRCGPIAMQQLSGLVALAERYAVPTGIRDMRVCIGRWAHLVTATAMPTAITWLASTWRVFSKQRIDRGFNTGAICQWQLCCNGGHVGSELSWSAPQRDGIISASSST